MLVEILLYVLFVVVGDGDERLTEDDTETIDALYLGHTHNIRTMSA